VNDIKGDKKMSQSNVHNKAKQYMSDAAIQTAWDQLPQIIQMAKLDAKLKKVNYDALMEAGFSKDEALLLCKK
jgi:hypothetical protein